MTRTGVAGNQRSLNTKTIPFGLVDHVEMVQKMFAEAELARKAGDEKLERATLGQIIQMYMWTNDHFRDVAHLLDRRYVTEYLDKMEKETRESIINSQK